MQNYPGSLRRGEERDEAFFWEKEKGAYCYNSSVCYTLITAWIVRRMRGKHGNDNLPQLAARPPTVKAPGEDH